jgi:hypothetical protein
MGYLALDMNYDSTKYLVYSRNYLACIHYRMFHFVPLHINNPKHEKDYL